MEETTVIFSRRREIAQEVEKYLEKYKTVTGMTLSHSQIFNVMTALSSLGYLRKIRSKRRQMKLSEAIFKMKPGDRFKYNSEKTILKAEENGNFRWGDGYGSYMTLVDAINLKDEEGEIIPAGPKVMTAEDLYGDEKYNNYQDLADYIEYGDDCFKNGRLEMWLEFKKRWENIPPDSESDDFLTAIEELKPE